MPENLREASCERRESTCWHRTPKDGDLRLSIIAFFSNSHDSPTCDGLYLYVPEAGRILKYTRSRKRWDCRQTHVVEWSGADWLFPIITQADDSCPEKGAP